MSRRTAQPADWVQLVRWIWNVEHVRRQDSVLDVAVKRPLAGEHLVGGNA